jgi:hypothetical protein
MATGLKHVIVDLDMDLIGWVLHEHEPGYLRGRVQICDVEHHIHFIRVITVVGKQGRRQVAWQAPDGEANNNKARLNALFALDPCNKLYETTELPGQEGDWICYMVPHQE